MEQDEETFRFNSRVEYENAIKEMLSLQNKKDRKKQPVFDEEAYDLLVNEYLRFCTAGADA